MRKTLVLSILLLTMALGIAWSATDSSAPTEQQLREHGDKVDSSLKSEIEAAIAETRTAIEGGDPETMKTKAQALAQVAMKLGQAIYEKEQASAASPGAEGEAAQGSEAGGEEEVVDAEFSEVDEGNKG